MEILPSPSFRTMPWANGQGQTCELFRLPHPTHPNQFAVRLSIATVALKDGPFSLLPGIDRQLCLLEGGGMRLTMEDGSRECLDVVGKVVEFKGEVGVRCELVGGAVRDFNVMVSRDCGAAKGPFEYLRVKEGAVVKLEAGCLCFAYLHEGDWELGGGKLPVPCLVVSREVGGAVTARSSGIAIVARVVVKEAQRAYRSRQVNYTRELEAKVAALCKQVEAKQQGCTPETGIQAKLQQLQFLQEQNKQQKEIIAALQPVSSTSSCSATPILAMGPAVPSPVSPFVHDPNFTVSPCVHNFSTGLAIERRRFSSVATLHGLSPTQPFFNGIQ
ncbi:hypothetical protein HDU98_007465 [Podochytrium sp. JEL0797]|nr:hypothetical protein HDU98_007465 [Podochytrium sp. JEL0797]